MVHVLLGHYFLLSSSIPVCNGHGSLIHLPVEYFGWFLVVLAITDSTALNTYV